MFRPILKFKTLLTPEIFFAVFGASILAAASIWVGIKQGNIEPYINRTEATDIFTYNNIFPNGYLFNDIAVSGVHSFLVKMPAFVVQNALGMNQAIYVITSVLCMLLMNAGLGYLIYYFSKKNLFVTGVLCIGLACATMLVDPSYPFMSLSWLTMRNVEIPLLVLFFVLAMRYRRYTYASMMSILIFGALLFVSDKLFLYYALAGFALYLVFQMIGSRSLDVRSEKYAIIIFFGSAILAYLIEFLLQGAGVVSFAYSYSPPLTLIGTVQGLLDQILVSISATMTVFGANAFGLSVKQAVVFVPTLALLALSVVTTYKLAKSYLTAKSTLDVGQRLTMLLIAVLLASYLIYVLIDRGQSPHGRFLVLSLPFGVLISAYYLRNIKLDVRPRFYPLAVAAAIFLMAPIALRSEKQYANYADKFGYERVAYAQVAGILNERRVDLLAGRAYVHNVQFVYSTLYGNEALPVTNTIKDCNDFGSSLRSQSLSKPSKGTSTSAIFDKELIGCSEKELFDIYGAPSSSHPIVSSKGVVNMLYVFDYDIRQRYKAQL